MKKLATLLSLIFGIVVLSGCSLTAQQTAEDYATAEQVTALQEQVSDISSQMENIRNEDEQTKKESKEIKKEKKYSLYYYNAALDVNQDFSTDSVDEVTREIPVSKTPIKDVFTLLFEANLTEEELNAGFSPAVFETYDFEIKSIVLNNGVLKIDFENNVYLSSMSSAERLPFRGSLRNTASQFPEIDKIQFSNDMTIGVKNPAEGLM